MLLTPVVMLLFELQLKLQSLQHKPDNRRKRPILFFLITWCIIFVCWIPYLLTFYPGGLVGDGVEVVRMAITPGVPSSSHWSIMYALILRAVIHIGSVGFHLGLNDCLFLYAILESIVYAASCAVICCELRRSFYWIKVLSYFSVLVFAISGYFALYSMTFWADGLFGSAIVLLSIQMWKCSRTQKIEASAITKQFLLELFICLWRNNGIYLVAFVLLGTLIVTKKDAIRPVLAGCIVIAITLILKGPIYDAFGISKDSVRESVSIPLQQMAATINSGVKLTAEQGEVLYAAAPEEVWKGNYCPTLSDDIKFKIDQQYLNTHIADFMRVWFELLGQNVGTYVRAYLMQTIGFWKLNCFQGLYWDYWYGVADSYNYGLVEKDLIEDLTGKSWKPLLTQNMWFISSGTVVWIMLFSFFSILYQGKDLARLLFLFPLLGCWITIMLAAPIAFAYRYVLALAMALPLVIVIPVYRKQD